MLLVTFIVAMSSILYELAFAQILSSILGGTTLQYILTIGFFVSFLGFGSLFYNKIILKFQKNSFFLLIEFLLIVTGVLSPLILNYLSSTDLNIYILYIVAYLLISFIGFLSGMELPFLMDQFNNKKFSYSGKVLAFDFFGTFLGTIIFPLILIPYFNLLKIPSIIALINVIGVIFFLIKKDNILKKKNLIFLSINIIIISITMTST